MNKQEFLQELERALAGRVSSRAITENLSYYSNYIEDEVRRGKSESAVLSALGDPRLLAKTIISVEANKSGTSGQEDTFQSRSYETPYQEDQGYDDFSGNQNQNEFGTGKNWRVYHFGGGEVKWYTKILHIVVLLFIIAAIVGIISGIISFVLPILLPILIIWLIVSFVRNNHR